MIKDLVTPVQLQQPGRIDNKIWRKWVNQSINQSINYKAAGGTAMDTPGLIKT